ncbi:MAG: formate/nitrite transporter family protein [Clostridiales bacterium]|nr:formate/nitrite transporter family protein [Clostridiales bacterium]
MKKLWGQLSDGLIAGIMISIGGSVFLSCNSDNIYIGKYVGALLFCIALYCICVKGYSLFTGKIGYIISSHTKTDFSVLLIGLLGNAIATIILGYALAAAIPSIKDAALAVCQPKLSQQLWQTLIRGIMCGILMYLAVDIYKGHKSVLGIIFCIPTFILCGFEHSIANTFYFAASGIVSLQALLFIFIVIIGNALGAFIIPLLKYTRKEKSE